MADFRQDRGASAVEYGLIVFAIAAAIALIVFAFGPVVHETYDDTCEEFTSKRPSSETCDN